MKINEFKKKYRQNICAKCEFQGICSSEEDLSENFTRCSRITICAECKIRDKCKTICPMIEGYINRTTIGNKRLLMSMENSKNVDKKEIIDKILERKYTVGENGVIYLNKIITKNGISIDIKEIPWQAVSPLVVQRIKRHFLKGLTYDEIAKLEGKNKHNYRIYKSVLNGLKKLRLRYEHIKYFEKIKEELSYTAQLYLKEYLVEGKTTQAIADKHKLSKARVAFIVARFFKRFEENKK